MGITPFLRTGLFSILLVEPSWPTVIIAGVVLVLAVLLVLYLLIVLEGAVFRASDKRAPAAAPAAAAPAAAAPAVTAAPAPAPVAGGIPGEVVAAIAGALACMEEQTGVRYAVQSIAPAAAAPTALPAAGKPVRSGRSAWARAGIAANTEPF